MAGVGLLLGGCTTDIAHATRKAGVRSVTVARQVDVHSPLRHGVDSNSGDLTVALSQIIVNEMGSKRISRLRTAMQEHEIRVQDMVHAQVSELLRSAKGLEVVTNAADAVLVVAIQQYGFEGSSIGDFDHVPFIFLRAELSRKGERLWKGEGRIHPWFSGKLGAKVDEYCTKPDLLRQHWEIQIDRAARKLLTVEKKE